jgi:transposase InsO family protein
MSTASMGESGYFVTFIDDYSRKVWVYFIKSKDQLFNVFKTFKAMVKNQTGITIKALRSDNGTEYTSTQMQKFY